MGTREGRENTKDEYEGEDEEEDEDEGMGKETAAVVRYESSKSREMSMSIPPLSSGSSSKPPSPRHQLRISPLDSSWHDPD